MMLPEEERSSHLQEHLIPKEPVCREIIVDWDSLAALSDEEDKKEEGGLVRLDDFKERVLAKLNDFYQGGFGHAITLASFSPEQCKDYIEQPLNNAPTQLFSPYNETPSILYLTKDDSHDLVNPDHPFSWQQLLQNRKQHSKKPGIIFLTTAKNSTTTDVPFISFKDFLKNEITTYEIVRQADTNYYNTRTRQKKDSDSVRKTFIKELLAKFPDKNPPNPLSRKTLAFLRTPIQCHSLAQFFRLCVLTVFYENQIRYNTTKEIRESLVIFLNPIYPPKEISPKKASSENKENQEEKQPEVEEPPLSPVLFSNFQDPLYKELTESYKRWNPLKWIEFVFVALFLALDQLLQRGEQTLQDYQQTIKEHQTEPKENDQQNTQKIPQEDHQKNHIQQYSVRLIIARLLLTAIFAGPIFIIRCFSSPIDTLIVPLSHYYEKRPYAIVFPILMGLLITGILIATMFSGPLVIAAVPMLKPLVIPLVTFTTQHLTGTTAIYFLALVMITTTFITARVIPNIHQLVVSLHSLWEQDALEITLDEDNVHTKKMMNIKNALENSSESKEEPQKKPTENEDNSEDRSSESKEEPQKNPTGNEDNYEIHHSGSKEELQENHKGKETNYKIHPSGSVIDFGRLGAEEAEVQVDHHPNLLTTTDTNSTPPR